MSDLRDPLAKLGSLLPHALKIYTIAEKLCPRRAEFDSFSKLARETTHGFYERWSFTKGQDGLMAYDEGVADRMRGLLADEAGLSEKKMFGGIAFLINGNMACGVNQNALIVRIDPAAQATALAEPGVRDFDLSGGRPMKGWIMVDPEGYAKTAQLKKWVARGVAFARSLPPK